MNAHASTRARCFAAPNANDEVGFTARRRELAVLQSRGCFDIRARGELASGARVALEERTEIAEAKSLAVHVETHPEDGTKLRRPVSDRTNAGAAAEGFAFNAGGSVEGHRSRHGRADAAGRLNRSVRFEVSRGRAVFHRAVCIRAVFHRAVFHRAVFDRAVFDRAVFHRAVFDRAVCNRAVFDRAVFHRAVFKQAIHVRGLGRMEVAVASCVTRTKLGLPDHHVGGRACRRSRGCARRDLRFHEDRWRFDRNTQMRNAARVKTDAANEEKGEAEQTHTGFLRKNRAAPKA
ncbi:MAG: pentapeptide repeat-containing protein [Myxococcota bacterium]